MTVCPDTGTLRATLDGEAAVTAHVSDCARCREELDVLRSTADATTGALALLAPPHDSVRVGSAPAPVDQHAPVVQLATQRARRAGNWQRRAAAAAVVVVMAGGIVGTPAGRQAAASFLAAFRSEQIAVVSIDPYSIDNAYWALQEIADVSGLEDGVRTQPVASLAAAERRVGFRAAVPDAAVLPERFGSEPAEIVTMDARTVRIAFDEERVAQYLRQHGSDAAVPPGLGDTTLVVSLPGALALTYRGPDFEQLVVGQSELLTADTEGPVDLEQVRSFLLDLPGLPPEAVQQLRAIDDWRTTLPLPVPADGPEWREVTVGGHEGVLFTDAFVSAVVWQAGGHVHGVGGVVDAATAQRIAADVSR